MDALSAGELWEFVHIVYKQAQTNTATLLYSIGNTQCRNFLGPRFEPHWALLCCASKLSPQHETLCIISTSKLRGLLKSIYTYCSNICPVLKRNRNTTFGAHRVVKKIFSH